MPDPAFDHPRLASVYDALDPDRSDLDVYAAMAEEFGATRVLDIGCGTGTLATMLARQGFRVVGVDPAGASLEVARAKPNADEVTWVHGIAADVLPLQVDLALMTANVAQVFLTDADWSHTLDAAFAALKPGGRLVFESRDPGRRAWEEWTPERTRHSVAVPHEGEVTEWVEVTGVEHRAGSLLVTFDSPTIFGRDGVRIDSTSTLRFRSREELAASLERTGFVIDEVRDAPDRPGREFVFVARRPGGTRFVPDGFEPPTSLVNEQFVLEPLGPQHNDADLAAWTSSIDHIRSTPGYPDGHWPPLQGMTSGNNHRDLRRHARDFVARKGFTFTVLDPASRDVIGCVYLYPPQTRPEDDTASGSDVVVQSWVRADRASLDRPLAEAVAAWLADAWPWRRPDRCGR